MRGTTFPIAIIHGIPHTQHTPTLSVYIDFSAYYSLNTLLGVAQGKDDPLCINVEYNVLGPMLKVTPDYFHDEGQEN